MHVRLEGAGIPAALRLSIAGLALGLVLLLGGTIGTRAARAAAEDRPAAAAEGQHQEGGGNPLEANPDLGIWTVIVFVLLLAILYRYAWGPLLAALEKREQGLKRIVDEAERNRAEALRLMEEHRRRIDQANEEVRGLIEQARRDAQKVRDELLHQAQTEAEATRDRAKKDIEQARDQAIGEIYSQTARLATEVAARVIGKSLTPEDHHRLLEQAVAELPANGAGSLATR